MTRAQKKRLSLVTMFNVFMSLLDLVVIAMIGALGSLAVREVQNKQAGDRVKKFLEFLSLENLETFKQILFLGIVIMILTISKSISFYVATKKIFVFSNNLAAENSIKLVRYRINSPMAGTKKDSIQSQIYDVFSGVSLVFVSFLGTTFSILSDIILLVLTFGLLVIVDPLSALGAFLMFGIVGVFQNRHNRLGITSTARKLRDIEILGNEKISDLLGSRREILVRNTQDFYFTNILSSRRQMSTLLAQQRMYPIQTKLVFENIFILLLVLVPAIQFSFNDTSRASGNVAIFLAAMSRIAPAALRIQQGLITVKQSIVGGEKSVNELSKIEKERTLNKGSVKHEISKTLVNDFSPSIEFTQVSFAYSPNANKTITNIDFSIKPFEFVALVGPSGAGKSTIVDLMIGIEQPSSGSILLAGLPPLECLRQWPGKVGFVPQSPSIHSGDLETNLMLGIDGNTLPRNSVRDRLKYPGLESMFEGPTSLLDRDLGEMGKNISGGQKQRIAIGRALFTNPKILILDEATSSLDAASESEIMETLYSIRGSMTLVVVAHRLSTIQSADRILFIDSGSVKGSGTFQELAQSLPQFKRQVELLNLAKQQ